MALKIRLAYQWRLFFPLIGLLWVLIGCMMVWQFRHEKDMRVEEVRRQMDYINARILYERDIDSDVFTLFRFLGVYFADDPIFSKMRVSVYDATNGMLIYNLGTPLPFDDADRYASNTEVLSGNGHRRAGAHKGEERSLYYAVTHSNDNNVVVYSAVPYDSVVADTLIPDPEMWIMIAIVALAISLVAYGGTRYVARNMKAMRTFATRAAHDPTFIPEDNFRYDELGDINRQIVHIFNERSKAIIDMQREHELALRTMEEKNTMKRRMTNNVSHELKTPVCIVKGYLDTIIANPDMDEASRNHFMRKAQENINRMDTLIKDLSLLNRFDEGPGIIPTEPVDYRNVVMTVESESGESGLLHNMRFINDVPHTMITGNFSLLVAMLHNLVKNAVAYSQGSQLGVRFDGCINGLYYFTFFDNGVGVNPEHIPHLFERFYCVDSGRSRKSCGTGLGLPIVYDTVRFHNGDISIANAPEGGLEFHYTFPVADGINPSEA